MGDFFAMFGQPDDGFARQHALCTFLNRRKVVIMKFAGRDFHNVNVVYRDSEGCDDVACAAAQLPGISGRRYPAALARPHDPDGIPVLDESTLAGGNVLRSR